MGPTSQSVRTLTIIPGYRSVGHGQLKARHGSWRECIPARRSPSKSTPADVSFREIKQIGGATGSRLALLPPENATGNYVKVVQRIPVRINFTNLDQDNSDHKLRPGFSVTPIVSVK